MTQEVDDFSKYLRNNGLNDEKWLPEFKKQGAYSEVTLQLLKGDAKAIEALKKSATNNVEKRAIDKLLKKEVEKRDPQKILAELEQASSERKKRNDERVQALDNELRTALNVQPGDWISNDKSLEDLISKAKSEFNISGTVISRDKLEQSLLLQKVSGGQALRGIFLTKQRDDQLEEKDQLLEVPKDVLITGASDAKYIIKQFSSSRQEDKYEKVVKILGHSVAVSASASFGGFSAHAGVTTSDRTENENTNKVNQKESYSSALKYATIYMASYSFKSSDLRLSKDAKENLKSISEIHQITPDSDNVQLACERIFYKFGR